MIRSRADSVSSDHHPVTKTKTEKLKHKLTKIDQEDKNKLLTTNQAMFRAKQTGIDSLQKHSMGRG